MLWQAAIDGSNIADVQKTTVYIDLSDYRRLKAIARARSVGASRRGDLSERAEELLAGLRRR